jgi:hypothetical protein
LSGGVTLYGGTGINLILSLQGITISSSTSQSGSSEISSLTPAGITGDIVGYRNSSWGIIKPNTVSMPLPNLGNILSIIGGFTSWNVAPQFSPGFQGRYLGKGTFLVHNTEYVDASLFGTNSILLAYDNRVDGNAVASATKILQGDGITFPLFVGSGEARSYTFLNSNGNFETRDWYNGGAPSTTHVGWAIRLSGVTSGGLVGGAFGGGIQTV